MPAFQNEQKSMEWPQVCLQPLLPLLLTTVRYVQKELEAARWMEVIAMLFH